MEAEAVFDFLTAKQVIFISLAGAALTGLGLIFIFINSAFLRAHFKGRASGEITDIDEEITRYRSKDISCHRLRVRFDTGSGVMEGLEMNNVVKPDGFYVGRRVIVHYRTDKPNVFFVEENDSISYAAKVLGVMLVAELVIAALVAAISRNPGV